MSWQQTAYKENSTKGVLLEMGCSEDFIEWLEENHYEPYDGMKTWIHVPTRIERLNGAPTLKLISFKELTQMYQQ